MVDYSLYTTAYPNVNIPYRGKKEQHRVVEPSTRSEVKMVIKKEYRKEAEKLLEMTKQNFTYGGRIVTTNVVGLILDIEV